MPTTLTPEQQAALDKSKTVVTSAEEALERLKVEGITDPKDLGDTGDTPPVIRYGDTESEADKYFSSLDVTAPTEAEQTTIRSDIRARMQNQIDAITQSYSRLIERAEETGVEAEAKSRAISARAGLLGSPRGEAIKTGVKEVTKGQVEAYEGERNIKIQGVLSAIDTAAEERIEAETLRAEGNMEKYLLYQEKAQTDARTNMAGLAESGVTLSRLKLASREGEDAGSVYQELLKDTGWSDLQFDAMYNLAIPEEEQINYNYTWKGDNLVAIGLDPATGKLVTETYTTETLGIPAGTDIDFIMNENTGEMFWYDKNDPTNEDGSLKTTSMGVMGKTGSGLIEAPTPEWSSVQDAFRSAISDIPGTQYDRDIEYFNRLMASGDINRAKEYVLQRAMESAPAAIYTSVLGRTTAIDSLDNIKGDLQEYLDNGGSTGILEGTYDEVLGKLGTSSDVNLRKIEIKMQLALINYRKSITGAQFSEPESEQYEKIFPDYKTTVPVNMATIEALKSSFQGDQDSFFKQKIGAGNYDKIFGGGESVVTPQTKQEISDEDLNTLKGNLQAGEIVVYSKEHNQYGIIPESELDETLHDRLSDAGIKEEVIEEKSLLQKGFEEIGDFKNPFTNLFNF